MKFKPILTNSLVCVLALGLASCDILSSSGGPRRKPVSLVNPQVGQSSRYLYFTHDCFYCRGVTVRTFQPDTLILELLAIETDGIVLRERISKGSLARRDSLHADSVGLWRPAEINDYKLKIFKDTIVFEEHSPGLFGSRLVEGIGFQPLPLVGIPEVLITLDDWKASTCTCNMQGLNQGFSQLGNTYSELIVIIDQEIMATDGPGFVFLYSLEDGLVMSYSSNPWTNSSLGWGKLY